MSALTGPAQRHLFLDGLLSNSPFLVTKEGSQFIDIRAAIDQEGAAANLFHFNQTGILLQGNSATPTAITGTVSGTLWADPEDTIDNFQLNLSQIHPLRFRLIRRINATGIMIVGF